MAKTNTIKIDPVTRIEGHGKVTINLNKSGGVDEAFLSVAEFRGFEKFCEGRMLWEMPTLTSRICGICPVSHHLASVKACESLLGVEPPPAATKLRELLHMGQIIHSHSLHFFFFALPDFLPAEGLAVEDRSVLGTLKNNKAVAMDAIKLRKVGQNIVDAVGGGRLHPVACIPGGMSKALDNYTRTELLEELTPAVDIAKGAMKMIKELYATQTDTFSSFASFPSYYMGLVKDDALELYDGPVRIIDQDGGVVTDFPAAEYLKHVREKVDARSWTKLPYYVPIKDDGFYRVASLARINIAKSIPTPLANAELKEFKNINDGKPVEGGLFYHYARMIEALYAVERAKQLLADPEILSTDVRIPVKRRGGEGVGVLEAPRGTLFHHYWADDVGKIKKVNIIVSTAHNKMAMNESIKMVAASLVKDGTIPEESLNKVEMAIRCYDPCLSCSSHAYGKMPLEITVNSHDNTPISSYKYGDLSGSA